MELLVEVAAIFVGGAIEVALSAATQHDHHHEHVHCHEGDIEVKTPTPTVICPSASVMVTSSFSEEKANHNSACTHHHGRYTDQMGTNFTRWSCCKQLNRNAAGCCTGRHLEDEETSQIMSKIDTMRTLAESNPELFKQQQMNEVPLEKEGMMVKRGHIVKNWKHRFFQLSKGRLFYYESRKRTTPLGEIHLDGCKVSMDYDGDSPRIRIYDQIDKKEYFMYAPNEDETIKWMKTISAAAEHLQQQKVLSVMKDFVIVDGGYVTPDGTTPTGNEETTTLQSQQITNEPPPAYDAVHNVTIAAPTAPPSRGDDETQVSGAFIKHEVRETDTLPGIALRYNTTVEAIKRVNKLSSDPVFTRRYLYIPHDGVSEYTPQPPEEVSEATVKRRLLKEFQRRTGVSSKEEADFYLDESDWNVDLAVDAYNKDIEWEKKQTFKH